MALAAIYTAPSTGSNASSAAPTSLASRPSGLVSIRVPPDGPAHQAPLVHRRAHVVDHAARERREQVAEHHELRARAG